MTDVKQSIAAKALGAFVAIAMVFSFVVPAAQANTTEELQQKINELLSQIQQLEAQIGGGSSSSVCPYMWTRSLSQGDTGMDVMRLQQYLNSNPDHRVAAAGQVGSAGMETEFYGPATAGAVTKFQQMYSSEVLAPVGLASGTGYFGPSTRAKINGLCDEGGSEGEGSGSGSDAELSGIGTLDTFEVSDVSNNDVQEGKSDVAVAEFEVEFQDGDARIDFMDIELLQSGANPWEAFENISLWVDGEKVAEADASSKSDYLGDEDDGIIRVTGLDIVAMDDEPVVISLAVSTFNNLDSDEIGTWNVQVEKVRYFDAAGVATTDSSTDGLASETATFDTEEAGQDEDLTIRTSSNDPDATTIVVDASTDTNDVEIFKFDVEADEGDLTLERMVVLVETGTASTTGVVDDAYLTIGGKTFKAETVDASLTNATTSITDSKSVEDAADGLGVWYTFDIDNDVTVDEDDRVEAVLSVDFKAADGSNYSTGETIQAKVDSAARSAWKAEGGDDLVSSDFKGSATGDSHLLQTEGVAVDFVSSTETFVENDDSTTTDNEGRFVVKVDVTAFETDVWIAKSAATGTGSATTSGMTYLFEDSSGVATTDSIDAVLTSTGDTETSAGGTTGMFVVREGQTETFTLTVEADPASSGFHRVKVYGVNFEDEDGTANQQQALPATDFESEYLNI